MSQIKNGRLGLYNTEHVTQGFKWLNCSKDTHCKLVPYLINNS